MMKLIADSGSTNTRWHLLPDTAQAAIDQCHTTGINPYFQSEKEILESLKNEFSMRIPVLHSIHFYGAGITDGSKKELLHSVLTSFFGVKDIYIESDLMAAARSLCQDQEGIAAILGTGSNSCYYDGSTIVQNVSPLGFILGDEGSGAVLGRTLIADILKNQLPDNIIKRFFETCQVTRQEILEHVYRKPFPNRYLASFTPFLLEHMHEEEVKQIITGSFMSFFRRNIAQYPQSHRLPVYFTGSIAWYFSSLLREVATKTGYTVGTITRDPIEGLLEFHKKVK